MLIRLTQKLSKKLKLEPLSRVGDDPGPFLEWYAHVFTADRTQYILTTEAKSLLSVVIYGRGVTDDVKFLDQWRGATREYLTAIDRRFVFKNIIEPKTGCSVYAKTYSKSIVGSMNDMVNVSKYMLRIRDMGPWDLSQMINETPFKAIGYERPLGAFGKLKSLRLV